MSLLEKICNELNVEIGEEWYAEGLAKDTKYKLMDDGLLLYKTPSGKWDWDTSDMMHLLTGKMKPIWKPEKGGKYYSPYILPSDEDDRYIEHEWYDTDIDELKFEKGLVFKTKVEAIEAANKMLNALKED